jgi:hypothetical protein
MDSHSDPWLSVDRAQEAEELLFSLRQKVVQKVVRDAPKPPPVRLSQPAVHIIEEQAQQLAALEAQLLLKVQHISELEATLSESHKYIDELSMMQQRRKGQQAVTAARTCAARSKHTRRADTALSPSLRCSSMCL